METKNNNSMATVVAFVAITVPHGVANPMGANSLAGLVGRSSCGCRMGLLDRPAFQKVMKTLWLLLTLSMALITSGCGGLFKGKKAAEQGVAEFHKLYNDEKLAEIYSAGDSKLKGATTEKQFLEFVGAVQRKLGKVTQTSNAGFNVRTFNLTTTVVLNQSTTFEQGTGTETFTFQMKGDKAVLVGYNINSNDLVLR